MATIPFLNDVTPPNFSSIVRLWSKGNMLSVNNQIKFGCMNFFDFPCNLFSDREPQSPTSSPSLSPFPIYRNKARPGAVSSPVWFHQYQTAKGRRPAPAPLRRSASRPPLPIYHRANNTANPNRQPTTPPPLRRSAFVRFLPLGIKKQPTRSGKPGAPLSRRPVRAWGTL